MWSRRPDIHHVRKFGALAYVHTKVGPSRHKFADNCRIGYVLGYRDGTLGCKVYFPSEGTVQVAGELTVNEQILYKDRHQNDFDRRVRDWAVAEHPDLTSTGRQAYDLPVVGGGANGNAIGAENRNSISPGRDGGSRHGLHNEGDPSWLRKPPPTFSDDVVFHPEVSRTNNTRDGGQEDRLMDGVVNAPDTNTSQETFDSSFENEPENLEEADEEQFQFAELMATTLLEEVDKISFDCKNDDCTSSKSKHTRPGLVELTEPQADELSAEELQVHAALTAIAMIADAPKQQKRTWHISDVRIPRTVSQEMNSPQRAEWWREMEKEVSTMIEKDVLELVPDSEMPEGTKPLETMWRFQPKTDEFGNILRYRSRLCARGDKEVPGVDFSVLDTFSPVARMASFRLFVVLCQILQLVAYQGDIDTAYLNAPKKLAAYIRRIMGFPLKHGWVYKVKNALYGLHESGREWHDELHGWLSEKGMARSTTEPCLYFRFEEESIALILVYVDDFIYATNNMSWKEKFFADINAKYGVKDLGRLNNYLGVQVEWQENGVLLHQGKYAKEILERSGFGDTVGCQSPMDTTVKLRAAKESDKEPGLPYREVIGALMYLATSTRPDLAFPVGYLSRFVQHPNKMHAGALKRVLRYLASTSSHGIFLKNQDPSTAEKIEINGFVDADWGNCPDTRKSVTGYLMMMAGGPVAWAARRQTIVALSTAEAEYAAVCEACQEGASIKNILSEIIGKRKLTFKLGVDNQAAIALATHPTYSRKTRHIELRLHYVRDMVRQKGVEIWKVSGDENPADLLTKPMGFTRLDKTKELAGMQPKVNQTRREAERRKFREGVKEDVKFRDAEN